MIYSEKWRKPIIDPMEAQFPCGMTVVEILGYPHASNDVFGCYIEFQGEKHKAVLKIERYIDANLANEWTIINGLKGTGLKTPEVITHGYLEDRGYIVTKYDDGQRLSQLIKNCRNDEIVNESLKYMWKFGNNLGIIHGLELIGENVKNRRFHNPMDKEKSIELGLDKIFQWLDKHKNIKPNLCFIHGDHHYANILWKDNEISKILDWELSGIGWKEFDLAWALILRPSQTFMKTKEERDTFLEGYSAHCSLDEEQLVYCMVMIYQYFYAIGKNLNDNEYMEYIISEFERLTGERV